jgi:hypothetical protein
VDVDVAVGVGEIDLQKTRQVLSWGTGYGR